MNEEKWYTYPSHWLIKWPKLDLRPKFTLSGRVLLFGYTVEPFGSKINWKRNGPKEPPTILVFLKATGEIL